MNNFSPSLNRVIFAGLPNLPDEFCDTKAQDWLASSGIAQKMREAIPGLPLPAIPNESGFAKLRICSLYPAELNLMLKQNRFEGEEVTTKMGIALAALIATLTTAPIEAQKARPEWPANHWKRWQQVKTIGLGGGIFSDFLGQRILEISQEWLSKFGADASVSIAQNPRFLPLLGTATQFPSGEVGLLDLGHTSVKCAKGKKLGNGSMLLAEMYEIPAPHGASLEQLLKFITDNATSVLNNDADVLGISIAAYTDQFGQPLKGQGYFYGFLADIPLISTLERELSTNLKRQITVKVVHDGTSAALALKNKADAAIVLGTSIGSGLNIPPSEDPL